MPGRMNPPANHVSRRAILRGAGCAMALPWLESFAAKSSPASPEAFPKRFAVVFLGFTALPSESGLFVFACVTSALLLYAHRGNIRRMLDGTESRFSSPAARWLRRGQ